MKKVFLALICCLALTACSNDAPTPQSAAQPASGTAAPNATQDSAGNLALSLRLGVMPSMDYLPLAVALREGYCAEEKLTLELVKFYSANDRDAALQSGSIDGAVIDLTGALLQKAGGFDVKLTSRCNAPFYVVAGQKSGITAPEQMKGTKLAVSRNTVIDYLLDRALAAANLTPDDVEKVEINKIPLRFEMLQSGDIDITGLPDPLALMASRAGNAVLATNRTLGFDVTGIVFRQEALNASGEAVRAMYRAYNRGAAYLRDNPVATVHDILTTEMGYPEALLSFATIPGYDEATAPRDEDMRAVSAWLEERGLIPAGFDPLSAVDGAFVR
ncbi:MetQ/NlpA family ABC transporter substrate-binding protein [Desulfovibrio sp. OttesenSCG-928-I05]|nr:MetQ/NlpA family ABC transporter substrate-binding protein [Desulfovibrio sp. OttesenSCG-928-I05]